MKNLFIAGIISGFVLFSMSCHQQEHHNDADRAGAHDHHAATTADNNLTLNNGAKWVVDDVTADNYDGMKTMTDMFAVAPSPSLSNYQIYGKDMSNALNKMIKECKMQGPDHDALHLWMEPLTGQINELRSISDSAAAKKVFDSVRTRVDAFGDYFTEAQ